MKKSWILILLCACIVTVAFAKHNMSNSSTQSPNPETQAKDDVVIEDALVSKESGKAGITIDYGTVEGFGVIVTLFPENRMTDTSCQALIDLEYEGRHKLFLHNVFRDPNQADTLASGTALKRKYQLPAGANARHLTLDIFSEMPFFFLDVDFDGEKELVLTLANQGQRWSNAYQPIHLGYDYLYDNLKEEPFTDFDDHSELDYDKNTITLYIHDGAGSWFNDVYTYKTNEGSMVLGPELISHVEIEYDAWDKDSPKKRIITERRDTTEWMAAKELLNK